MTYVYDFLKDGCTDSDAVKTCFAAADSIVVFDKKDWHIDEAVLLPSDITVIIDDCTIKQNDFVFDNVFRGANVIIDPENPFGKPLAVNELKGVKIMGRGNARIVGCDINRKGFHSVLNEEQEMVGDFWGWRTHQISLSNCAGFEVVGIKLSQTRGWAISFDSCSGGYVCDLHIESNVKNGDGVNFRSGCHHCRVSNITGFTSDDTVACSALCRPNREYPTKNYLYPSELYNCLWDGNDVRSKDVHDISISKIHTDGYHHGVICLAANGRRVYNIDISDVIEGENGQRECAVKLYTGYGDGYTAGDIHDIKVEKVKARISEFAVLCNTRVYDVILKSIDGECSLAYTDGIKII